MSLAEACLKQGDEMNKTEIENREVSWKVLDIEIFGTITSPVDDVSHPGIVLVAGSGPTDRDWCTPLLPGTNGSGRLLAEELAHNGFVTLRYDKMASGPHVKENIPKFSGRASMQTHVDELAGAVSTINSQKNVVRDEIFALTNSEGAIHAVNYQLNHNGASFKGLILTGAPGRSVGEVGREQIIAQVRQVPNADEILRQYDKAISQFLSGEPLSLDNSLPEGLRKLLTSLETPANLPFSRELWSYSLSEHIGKIRVPVLVVIGKKDIQVSWNIDGKALEEALTTNQKASFEFPDNANHVMKFDDLPLDKLTAEHVATSYNSPEAKLDEEAVKAILSWLSERK